MKTSTDRRTSDEAARVAGELATDVESALIDAMLARIGPFTLAQLEGRVHGFTRGGPEDWTAYYLDDELLLEVSPVRFETTEAVDDNGRRLIYAWHDLRRPS